MRIIGGKDYYDGAGYGIDKSILFIRDCQRITIRELPKVLFRDVKAKPSKPINAWDREHFCSVQVYFCGKLYLGLYTKNPGANFFIWSLDELNKYLNDWDLSFDNYDNKSIKEYFDDSGKPKNENILIDKKITIATFLDEWLIRDNRWEVNSDNLKHFEFYKVKDAFTAHQEIAMWVGGVLTNNPSPPQIVDEKIRIAKRGFDPVTSFRKGKK